MAKFKWIILSSFTHPPLVPNLSSVEHRGRKLITKQLMVAIDFHSMEKILLKSMATVNILQNIFFCLFSKETHTGLEQLEGVFQSLYCKSIGGVCISVL